MVSRRSLILVLTACALTPACNNLKHTKCANFDLAMQRPAKTDNPPVFHVSGVPHNLPESTPYVILKGDFDGGTDEGHASLLKRHAKNLGFAPDYLIYAPQGSAYAGTVSTYIGFGVSTSSAVTRPQGIAYCMRELGFSTGLRWDDRNMVTEVSDKARSIGILEGDTLVSIAGSAVSFSGSQASPWSTESLRWKPGDIVKLIWIRPGTGRMEGELALDPPTPWPTIRSFIQDHEKEAVSRDNVWRNGT